MKKITKTLNLKCLLFSFLAFYVLQLSAQQFTQYDTDNELNQKQKKFRNTESDGLAPSINYFETTWKTDNPGVSNSTSITIPTGTETYNYDVDWNNDGVYDETGITGAVTHDYGTAGTYTIRIRGTFPYMGFNNGGDKDKILSVNKWGNIAWTSMRGMFHGCSNIVFIATDVPDLSNVTDMGFMFADAVNFNSDVSNWDVSNITNMSRMFRNAASFNQDIGNWNVSNVTNMSFMFNNAAFFNQDLSGWDTSNVSDMGFMFNNASTFNQSFSGVWNTDNVNNLNSMFRGAISFNQNINDWNISNVTNISNMFNNATSYNQDMDNWDTSKVTNMEGVFKGANAFNGNISTWDLSNVTTIRDLFSSASSFNQSIGSWNVGNVTDMISVFENATAFNQDISTWDVANVTSFYRAFKGASTFNQSLSTWNIANAITLGEMLTGTAMNVPNYDALLVAWGQLPVNNNVVFGAPATQYCQGGEAARTKLIKINSWSISGDLGLGRCFILSRDDYDLNAVKIYPNPTSSILNIETAKQLKSITIYTVLGKVITKTTTSSIDVSNLKSGMYLLEIEDEEGNLTSKRFVKE